jgi:ubiquinone/menaquinone biosynthesis C-methylase UbiE
VRQASVLQPSRAERVRHRECPCCKAAIDSGFRQTVYAPFTLLRCPACRFRFVGDPLSDDELKIYYREHYATEGEENYRRIQRDNGRRGAARLERMARRMGRSIVGQQAIDVGAGYGYLVQALRDRGVDAVGIDPSESCVSYGCEKLGIPLSQRSLEEVEADGQRYDIVTLGDVIEHISQPVELLSACRSILKPDGLLVIKTDHFESTAAQLMGLSFYRLTPVEHISLFTPTTLSTAARRAGFECVATESWTPAFAVRWAIKHCVMQFLKGPIPPPDPLESSKLGGGLTLMGRVSTPIFALLAPFFNWGGRGTEFMSLFRPLAASKT